MPKKRFEIENLIDQWFVPKVYWSGILGKTDEFEYRWVQYL